MGTPGPSSLSTLAEDVKRALVGLSANLRKSLYKDSAVKSLDNSVIKLNEMIQAELLNDPFYANRGAVRDALSSLRSVEGLIKLIRTASEEYARSRVPAERHEIQDVWMDRQNRLLDRADLCVESLEVVLAFADYLDERSFTGESANAESDIPDDTAAPPASA